MKWLPEFLLSSRRSRRARVALHVLAATVWVGGQVTLAGLVPTARQLGQDAPRLTARAFSRLSWPAHAVVLTTGIWNVAAVQAGQRPAWQVVLGVKIAVVLLTGLKCVAARSRPEPGCPCCLGRHRQLVLSRRLGSRRRPRWLRKPERT